ncbi:hypothetical protein BHE74_00003229 [Ensete ventricosum]|nr:hypothetical protein BHE74_00003229 [Ensete ventricosum]RZR86431.1 hypothetical protein BHM03_00013631 [Ensete ventricosum]
MWEGWQLSLLSKDAMGKRRGLLAGAYVMGVSRRLLAGAYVLVILGHPPCSAKLIEKNVINILINPTLSKLVCTEMSKVPLRWKCRSCSRGGSVMAVMWL